MVNFIKKMKLDIHIYNGKVAHITHKYTKNIWFCYYAYDELFEEVENNKPYFYIHIPNNKLCVCINDENFMGERLINFIKRKRLEPYWLRFKDDAKEALSEAEEALRGRK